MAKRVFENWMGELRELVRDELDNELEEINEYDPADARAYHREGYSPRYYMKECLLIEAGESENDVDEILRDFN